MGSPTHSNSSNSARPQPTSQRSEQDLSKVSGPKPKSPQLSAELKQKIKHQLTPTVVNLERSGAAEKSKKDPSDGRARYMEQAQAVKAFLSEHDPEFQKLLIDQSALKQLKKRCDDLSQQVSKSDEPSQVSKVIKALKSFKEDAKQVLGAELILEFPKQLAAAPSSSSPHSDSSKRERLRHQLESQRLVGALRGALSQLETQISRRGDMIEHDLGVRIMDVREEALKGARPRDTQESTAVTTPPTKRLDQALLYKLRNASAAELAQDATKSLDKGDQSEALQFARHAVHKDSQNPQYRRLLGYVHEVRRETSEALREYRRAARLDPKDSWTRTRVGDLMLKAGDVQYALKSFEAALKLSPRNAHLHLCIGYCQEKLENFKESRRKYERAISLDPTVDPDRRYLENLARAERNRVLRRRVQLNPEEVAILRPIFKDKIDYSAIELREQPDSFFEREVHGVKYHAHASASRNVINHSQGGITAASLVHEAVHIWQTSTNSQAEFIWDISDPQILAEIQRTQTVSPAYDYTGYLLAGKGWEELNREQQARLIENAYLNGYYESGGRKCLLIAADRQQRWVNKGSAQYEQLLSNGYADRTEVIRASRLG